MSNNAESVDAGAVMSATRYQDAAWIAFDLGSAPPDPSSLPDRALTAILLAMMQYETPSLLLPVDANLAVEREWRRRGLSPKNIDRVIAGAVLALAAVSGAVIGWALLAA
jgi:hypothetical protein